jgi:hypothetical protein
MLRSELVRPVRVAKSPLLMMGFGGGLIGAAIAMFVMPPRVREIDVPIVAAAQPPAPGPSDIHMVFRAGGTTYMKIGDAPALHMRLTVHEPTLVENWQTSAVADLEEALVPKEQRHWLGASVIVDGACKAKVTGISVVARVRGSADYAGEATEEWNASSIYEHGAPVLAAKLDNCEGIFARDAALPRIVMFEPIEDYELARLAEEQLVASKPARAVQRLWEAHSDGDWTASGTTEIGARVLRHPITKETWVYVHASRYHECGGNEMNVWGLYRVVGGHLVTVQERAFHEIHVIEYLIDLEGDGEFEIVGIPSRDDASIVQRASGEEVTRLVLPDYVPC